MRINMEKRGARSRLVCTRADGSTSAAEVGPQLPHHDLAHFVVENHFRVRQGFFGLVAQGYAIRDLGDREKIPALPKEIWVAETLARGLGALVSGACRPEQFFDLVAAELGEEKARALGIDETVAGAMSERFFALLLRWQAVSDGESLDLDWPD